MLLSENQLDKGGSILNIVHNGIENHNFVVSLRIYTVFTRSPFRTHDLIWLDKAIKYLTKDMKLRKIYLIVIPLLTWLVSFSWL